MPTENTRLTVVSLCAQWCGVCRDWRPVLDQLAGSHPQVAWRWLDIEDEADLLDDLDVETFPTLLVARGPEVLFFGPTLPQAEGLARLLASLRDAPPAAGVPTAARALWHRLSPG